MPSPISFQWSKIKKINLVVLELEIRYNQTDYRVLKEFSRGEALDSKLRRRCNTCRMKSTATETDPMFYHSSGEEEDWVPEDKHEDEYEDEHRLNSTCVEQKKKHNQERERERERRDPQM